MLKELVFQPLESKVLSRRWVSNCLNLHPYIAGALQRRAYDDYKENGSVGGSNANNKDDPVRYNIILLGNATGRIFSPRSRAQGQAITTRGTHVDDPEKKRFRATSPPRSLPRFVYYHSVFCQARRDLEFSLDLFAFSFCSFTRETEATLSFLSILARFGFDTRCPYHRILSTTLSRRSPRLSRRRRTGTARCTRTHGPR